MLTKATERERMLAVYRGDTPDRVPFFLDLSHWFYQRHKIPFDLSVSLMEPDWPLIEYHKRLATAWSLCRGFVIVGKSPRPKNGAVTTR